MKRIPKAEPAPDTRPDGLPVLMKTAEVAELLQVDTSTLCRWRQAGSVPARRGSPATCRATSRARHFCATTSAQSPCGTTVPPCPTCSGSAGRTAPMGP